MHSLPKHFDVPDLTLARQLIQQHPLATLMLMDPMHGLSATPVPMVWGVEGERWFVEGHLPRANPHVAALAAGSAGEVLVQFNGPDAYVSPRHYDQPMSMPAWNYLTLQIGGRVQLLDDPLVKDKLLKRLIATQEPAYARQWSGLPADVQGKLLGAVVGLRIPVERCVLKVKISQNRNPAERERILAHQRVGTPQEQLLALWMSRLAQR